MGDPKQPHFGVVGVLLVLIPWRQRHSGRTVGPALSLLWGCASPCAGVAVLTGVT